MDLDLNLEMEHKIINRKFFYLLELFEFVKTEAYKNYFSCNFNYNYTKIIKSLPLIFPKHSDSEFIFAHKINKKATQTHILILIF